MLDARCAHFVAAALGVAAERKLDIVFQANKAAPAYHDCFDFSFELTYSYQVYPLPRNASIMLANTQERSCEVHENLTAPLDPISTNQMRE
jgi:hypothetical protein